jgi:hypothetical protein
MPTAPSKTATPGLPDRRTYERYRRAGQALNGKIIEAAVGKAAFDFAGRTLGIAHGGVLVFDSEIETNVLMDFALYDYRVSGKNAVERYRKERGAENAVERELLAAMAAASLALFRVEAVARKSYSLTLLDLANPERRLALVDISLSQSLVPGVLQAEQTQGFGDGVVRGLAHSEPARCANARPARAAARRAARMSDGWAAEAQARGGVPR